MLRLIFFRSSWHYGISKLYYPRLFILKSLPLKVLCYSCIFIYIILWWILLTRAKVFHIFSRCSLECYVNTISILCKFSCECLVVNPSYPHLHFICFLFTSLHCYIPTLVCYIVLLHIFHIVNVDIALMVYVSTWFSACVGVNAV